MKIEFLELEPASYGWTAIFPGHLNFGLLADEFPDPGLKIWDLETHRRDGYTVFKEGIHIPIKPYVTHHRHPILQSFHLSRPSLPLLVFPTSLV